ncbi:MAG: hypothetical protein RIN55_03120 [Tissierellaceae bacterium]|nr:hypothetical protein [Tissierellaceae bacterium]
MIKISQEKIKDILVETGIEVGNVKLDTIVGIVNNYMLLKKKDLSRNEIRSIIIQYINQAE